MNRGDGHFVILGPVWGGLGPACGDQDAGREQGVLSFDRASLCPDPGDVS